MAQASSWGGSTAYVIATLLERAESAEKELKIVREASARMRARLLKGGWSEQDKADHAADLKAYNSVLRPDGDW